MNTNDSGAENRRPAANHAATVPRRKSKKPRGLRAQLAPPPDANDVLAHLEDEVSARPADLNEFLGLPPDVRDWLSAKKCAHMSDATTEQGFNVHAINKGPIESLGYVKAADLPDGYILLSEAVRRLQMSMWAGLKRPIALQKVRAALRKEGVHHPSLGFGLWRQRAGQYLARAAFEGKLEVDAVGENQGNPVCTRIPAKVLRQLMLVRGSLPDRAIRPSLKACDGDRSLLLLLQRGCLVVKESEFSRWLKVERRRGKWSSQRSRQKPRTGRPTKQTKDFEDAILKLVHHGFWSGGQPVEELWRQLIDSGRDDVPSAGTIARRIDKLHDEIGHPGLRRSRRAPRRR